jgi:hypothetical protein
MINTKQITHDALEAEARGDFATAVKLYNDVSSRCFCLDFKSIVQKL